MRRNGPRTAVVLRGERSQRCYHPKPRCPLPHATAAANAWYRSPGSRSSSFHVIAIGCSDSCRTYVAGPRKWNARSSVFSRANSRTWLPSPGVLLVPPPRLAVRPGDRLALPVDEVAADGVVAVAGRGGERAAGLVQREREQVGGQLLHVQDAALPRHHPRPLAFAARGEDLDAGVAGVDVERDGHAHARSRHSQGEPRGIAFNDSPVDTRNVTGYT